MRLIKNTIKSTVKNTSLLAIVAGALMIVGGGSAIAGHMITGKQVKNSSLTGKDVRNGSLTGVDIKNKSINAGDLTDKARDALKGNVGPQGVPGYGTILNYANYNQEQTNGVSWNESIAPQQITVPEGASKLYVSFNAECGVVDSDDLFRNHNVLIRVDGQNAGIQNRMCNNRADFDALSYSTNTIQRVVDVTPGVHTVEVLHGVSSANATGYLDNKVLTATVGN